LTEEVEEKFIKILLNFVDRRTAKELFKLFQIVEV